MMSRASARAIKSMNDRLPQAGWNHSPAEKEKDMPPPQNPTTGRTTKMGRRAEKPKDPKPGGPSGQSDRAKHNKKHANT